ncbi:melanocortin receptor 3-like [Oculina patagonica]
MAQNLLHLSNQSCWNCSTAIPQGTTALAHISKLLSKEETIILSVVCALASVMGTLGNSLVLLAVRNNANLRTKPDLFITSLAFSDFTVCALFLPMMIYNLNHRAPDDQYVIFHSVKLFLGHAAMVASTSNLFAVTVDRVVAIRFPYKYIAVMTTRNALVGIVLVWCIAVAFGIVYGLRLISPTYVSLYNLTMLLSTIIMNISIFSVAKRQENRIRNMHPGHNGSVAEKKVAKTIFIVVGVYFLCWAPLFLLPAFVNPAKNMIQFQKSIRWVNTLLACNSAFNPYIYCMRSKKYRTAFGKLLRLERCTAQGQGGGGGGRGGRGGR